VALGVLVLFVATLATLVSAIATGHAPHRGVTIVVTAVVVAGLVLLGRAFWRSTRAIESLMDAADRVAAGEYSARVGHLPARSLQRIATSFDAMAERLETNEERRRELLADVAHELRTPLQAIRGQVEGMLDGLYPADEEHLRPVVARTETMARLLEDLRTLSMAEAGVLELHRETVDPLAVATSVVEGVRPRADRAGVDLIITSGPTTPRTIEADALRLDEVLANLMTNAVQHTPRGGDVAVSVDGTAGGGVRFTVDDTGSGIDDAQLPYVFDRFVRASDTGGTGLGLAISRRLVEAHGGSIAAGRSPGGGTRISVELP
jgi:two-component system sensor histidine kinase BaeS